MMRASPNSPALLRSRYKYLWLLVIITSYIKYNNLMFD